MTVRLYVLPALLLLATPPAYAQDTSTTGATTQTATAATGTGESGIAPPASDSSAAAPVATDVTPAATASEPKAAASARAATIIDTSKDYRIGPEDVLDILVWKQDNLSRTVPVRPDGKVSLPLVNDIVAAGLTPTELRQQITDRLTEFVPSPEVSVIVKEVHSVKVAVLGSVRMPGHYEVKSPATVLELIARAQGFTEFANRDRIVVLRQSSTGATRVQFNYRKVADGSEQDNFFVRPGDIIVVP